MPKNRSGGEKNPKVVRIDGTEITLTSDKKLQIGVGYIEDTTDYTIDMDSTDTLVLGISMGMGIIGVGLMLAGAAGFMMLHFDHH